MREDGLREGQERLCRCAVLYVSPEQIARCVLAAQAQACTPPCLQSMNASLTAHRTVSFITCCCGKVNSSEVKQRHTASLQALSRIRLHRQPRALTLLSLWLLGLLAMWMPAPKAIDGPALEHYEAKLNEAAAGDRAETLAVQAWWQAQAELEAERTWFWFLVRLCVRLGTQCSLSSRVTTRSIACICAVA